MWISSPPALVTPSVLAEHDLRNFDRFVLGQGDSSACGPTSLAMIFNFWAGKPGVYSRHTIDLAVRKGDHGTSPTLLSRYARSQGFRASALNHTGLSTLQFWLERGVPVQILLDNGAEPGAGHLHFVVASEFTVNAAGQIATLVVADPWLAGKMRTLPLTEFLWRWRDLRLGLLPTGMDEATGIYLPKRGTTVRGRNGQTHDTTEFTLGDDTGFDWHANLVDAYFGLLNLVGRAD